MTVLSVPLQTSFWMWMFLKILIGSLNYKSAWPEVSSAYRLAVTVFSAEYVFQYSVITSVSIHRMVSRNYVKIFNSFIILVVKSEDIHECIPEFFMQRWHYTSAKIISDYEKCVTLCGPPLLAGVAGVSQSFGAHISVERISLMWNFLKQFQILFDDFWLHLLITEKAATSEVRLRSINFRKLSHNFLYVSESGLEIKFDISSEV